MTKRFTETVSTGIVTDNMTGNVLKEIGENIKDYEEQGIEQISLSLVKYWISVLENENVELDTHKHPLWSTREAERKVSELTDLLSNETKKNAILLKEINSLRKENMRLKEVQKYEKKNKNVGERMTPKRLFVGRKKCEDRFTIIDDYDGEIGVKENRSGDVIVLKHSDLNAQQFVAQLVVFLNDQNQAIVDLYDGSKYWSDKATERIKELEEENEQLKSFIKKLTNGNGEILLMNGYGYTKSYVEKLLNEKELKE